MIKRVYSEMMDYNVGKDDVVSIELTEHGGEITTTYKITYEDGSYMFAGFKEHEVIEQ